MHLSYSVIYILCCVLRLWSSPQLPCAIDSILEPRGTQIESKSMLFNTENSMLMLENKQNVVLCCIFNR